ncbi:hypothetical protein WM23_04125 [Burkholderia ubonensis]|nr:hypothetical protein WM23_04125 [Burkholderia ubonensis]
MRRHLLDSNLGGSHSNGCFHLLLERNLVFKPFQPLCNVSGYLPICLRTARQHLKGEFCLVKMFSRDPPMETLCQFVWIGRCRLQSKTNALTFRLLTPIRIFKTERLFKGTTA